MAGRRRSLRARHAAKPISPPPERRPTENGSPTRGWETFEQGQTNPPGDDELTNASTSLKSSVATANGTVWMEEKGEAKKRLGKSPDLAGSNMLSNVEQYEAALFGLWRA